MIKRNEGTTDRIVRVLLGGVLLGIGLIALTGTAKVIVVTLGIISFATGAIGFCALYTILGISTVEKKK